MWFIICVLVAQSTALTATCFVVDHDNLTAMVWMATGSWWALFLYLRSAALDPVISKLYHYQSVLPDYLSMVCNPRFFHLWTLKQWSSWVQKRVKD